MESAHTEENNSMPKCCINCIRWEKFGKNCFYYWESKKHCTMHAPSWDEADVQQ